MSASRRSCTGSVSTSSASRVRSHERNPMSERPLTLALAKARTLGPVAAFFERAGTPSAALPEESRALVRRARFGAHELELFLLKPDDVPTYVEYGTADLGV